MASCLSAQIKTSLDNAAVQCQIEGNQLPREGKRNQAPQSPRLLQLFTHKMAVLLYIPAVTESQSFLERM